MLPTDQILNRQLNLQKRIPKFRKDLDNDDEDSLSDDEVIEEIKMRKCLEATQKAEAVTEQTAVRDII